MQKNEIVLLVIVTVTAIATVVLAVLAAIRGDGLVVVQHVTTLGLLAVSVFAVLTNAQLRELRSSVRALEAAKTGRVSS